jgi:chromosome segregation ATPase
MAKEMVSKPVVAAVETALQQFMPQLTSRLDGLQGQISDLRQELDHRLAELRREINETAALAQTRFERTQELFAELGIKINTVGTRLDAFTDILKFVSGNRDDILQRLVRLEMTKGPTKAAGSRKKRAG